MDDHDEEESSSPNNLPTKSTKKTSKRTKNKFPCQFCDNKFVSSRNRRLHLCSIHPDKFLLSAKPDHVPDHQFQIICFDFLSKHNWRKTNLNGYKYGCLYCEENSRNSSFLKMHLINNHVDIITRKLKQQQNKSSEEVTITEFNEEYQTGSDFKESSNSAVPKQEDDDDPTEITDVPKHDRVRTYKCSHCEMTYFTVLSLTTHKRESHPEIMDEPKFVYPCDMCGVTFSSKCNLGRHKKGRCKAPPRKEIASFEETKRIQRLQKRETNLWCTFCNKKFISSRNCRLHVCCIHPEKFLASAKLDNVSDHQFQIICFDFLSKQNWRKNNLIQFNYPYGCLYCEENFRNSSFVKVHLIDKHLDILISKAKQIQSELEEEVTVIEHNEQCQPGIKLEDEQKLVIPKKEDEPLNNDDPTEETCVPKYDNVRTYKCSHCFMTFLTVLSLTAHKRESHPEILDEPKFVYPCDMCGITLSSKCNLRRHKKGRCKMTRTDKVSILESKKIRLEEPDEETEMMVKIDTEDFNGELEDPLA